jgi:hypothetical protein
MDQAQYTDYIHTLPPQVLLDLEPHVHRLRILFGPEQSEFILHCIIDDVADRVNYVQAVRYRTNQIFQSMLEKSGHEPGHPAAARRDRRPQLFDSMIAFEQTALGVQREIEAMKLYVMGRYMPYRYETTLPRGMVMLTRINEWVDFMDLYPQAVEMYPP